MVADIARGLQAKKHYTLFEKEKQLTLTDAGMVETERVLGVRDLWDVDDPWATYVLASLKAKHFYLEDRDYVVKDQKVRVDEWDFVA
jgi:preprotein translocase subunit SecA